jgi:4-hydroxy-tetrahydrodipicolinate synthase
MTDASSSSTPISPSALTPALLGRQVVTAMVTPFLPSGELDLAAVPPLVQHLLSTGTNAVLVAGTTGEGTALSLEEKETLLAAVLQSVAAWPIAQGLKPEDKKVGVWLCVGSNVTSKSVEEVQHFAATAGLEAILSVAPYYNRPPQAGLFGHFEALAKACAPLPLLLYNIPGRCATRLEPATIYKLATHCPNIVGLKQCYNDLEELAELRRLLPAERFMIWSGDDAMTLPMMALGAQGVVSVAGHVAGALLQTLTQAMLNSDLSAARAAHYRLLPIVQALFAHPNPLVSKALLAHLGLLPYGTVRLPLAELSPAEQAALLPSLQQHLTALETTENHALFSQV